MFVQPVDYFLAIRFCIAHQQEFHDGRNGACHEFLMMGRDMRAMEPTELLFWGVMSLGVIVGFATAYPVNVWLVKRGLKHGLMTERKPDSRFSLVERQADANAHQGHAA